MSKTRVLLTGERGFLGKRVAELLGADPAIELVPLGKRLGELEAGEHPSLDVVVHLAAWTTKRSGASDIDRVIEANVLGLRDLLRALDPPPRRMLFASTADVYGPASGLEITEQMSLRPADAYAASKVLGEQFVVEDARERDYEASTVRIAHLYGPGEESYEKLVPVAIRALMQGRPPTVVGDGETRRDLLYVDDAAEAIRRLVLAPQPLPPVLNLAAPETYSLNEIAGALIDVVGFIGRIRYLSDRSNPPSIGFDTGLLEETIGAWDRVALAEGLAREVRHVVALEASEEAAR
ncbi:MAG TPA: NAD-dependent epimerase/dehydratase family protein [Solirubrobacteraceae bacterium]|nr:NAD-dependent epimerase/dehydratase family protein [Solirubrobacteraceae bacterium]